MPGEVCVPTRRPIWAWSLRNWCTLQVAKPKLLWLNTSWNFADRREKMNFQRCSDGSDGRRGFVSTPANDTDWPVCKYGTARFFYKQNPCSVPNSQHYPDMENLWVGHTFPLITTANPQYIEPWLSSLFQLQFALCRLLHPLVVNERWEAEIKLDFKKMWTLLWRFHTLWCQRSPRRAVRWTRRRTNWSASLSRLSWQNHNQLDICDDIKFQLDLTFCLCLWTV